MSIKSSSNWFDFDDALLTAGSSSNSKMVKKKKTFQNCLSERRALADDDELWIFRHRPRKTADLAVQPKKVAEVRDWIINALSRRRKRNVLVLSGPPGSGKTATLECLSAELGFQIRNWTNPSEIVNYDNSNFVPNDAVPYQSQISSFRNFLRRAGKYNPLPGLDDRGSNVSIVVIEELPSFAYRNVTDFQSVILDFGGLEHPLIFVVSESDDTKTIYSPEFVNERLRAGKINLNPVTSMNCVKVLKNIGLKESREGVRPFQMPDQSSLISLAESTKGDIRASINALQFACLKNEAGDLKDAFEGNSETSGKKRSKQRLKIKKSNSLASIGGKDPTLDMFHAMGKVLYAKRDEKLEDETLIKSETRLKPSLQRLNQLNSDPEEILAKAPTSSDSFACFLHQNYLQHFNRMDKLAEACEYFSSSDGFFSEWTTTGKMNLSEYGGSLVIRGLQYFNVDPVKPQGMRTFHKPEWYATNKKARLRVDELTKTFEARGLDHLEIITNFVPILVKLGVPCSEIVRKVGTFAEMSSEANCDYARPLNGGNLIEEEAANHSLDENDVDFLIEEF